MKRIFKVDELLAIVSKMVWIALFYLCSREKKGGRGRRRDRDRQMLVFASALRKTR